MDLRLRAILWQQFGAAIDMLDNAMDACPDDLWGDRSEKPEFWYVAFHTLFFLDLYLSGSGEGFAPPAPFTLDEVDPAGVLPETAYRKDELHAYLNYCRRKCRATIEALTDERAVQVARFWDWTWEISFLELLLYTMRHVQEHNGQLSQILGQKIGWDAPWVSKARAGDG